MSAESKQYILIAGLPRSGSTLLQAILNQSDSTFTMPEMHFFEQAKKISEYPYMSKNQVLELLEILKNKWKISTGSLAEKVRAYSVNSNIDLCELYFRLIDQHRPGEVDFLIGVEKTPGNLFALDELLKRKCNIKVILTSRNPLDFANSLIKQSWSPDSISKICRLWNQSMIKINELRKKYPARVMVLDYSEMISKPEKAFAGAYKFTGLEWQEKYLSDINSKADEFVIPLEEQWKAENINQPNISKSVKKCSLSFKQRLLLHRECLKTALRVGYIRRYKF